MNPGHSELDQVLVKDGYHNANDNYLQMVNVGICWGGGDNPD